MLVVRQQGLGRAQVSNGQRYESRDYDGIPKTIDDMRRLVQDALTREQAPELRRLTESVIAQVEPKDYLSEIAACYYHILKNFRYTRDPYHVERTSHPYVNLQPESWDRAAGRSARQGDCDDAGITLAAMCMSIGNSCEFITITTDATQDFHHVFVAVKVPDGRRIVLDPVPGPHVQDMISRVVRYAAWPIEPVRVQGQAGWRPLAAPMAGWVR